MPADPLRSLPKIKAAFVEPMNCLPVSKLPEGPQWLWDQARRISRCPTAAGDQRLAGDLFKRDDPGLRRKAGVHQDASPGGVGR
jgi:hypothetical protein